MEGPPVAAKCVECGSTFAVENMIRYGTQYVCASCKPVFMQKLAEGVGGRAAAGAMRYAGFWIRVGALMIDRIIAFVVFFVIAMIVVLIATGSSIVAGSPEQLGIALQLALQGGMYVLLIAYEVIMTAQFGGTLGKLICGLRIVSVSGERISYLHALGRSFAHMLSGVICFIGYIMAAFDDEKRALHDRICDTRVIFK